ncbi:MAG TPA: hypothetical protein PLB52_01585 [Candidatus Moranbacteria bacterium]|nr:hypothetical protein [Candidatus Moranbacteria bacterium]
MEEKKTSHADEFLWQILSSFAKKSNSSRQGGTQTEIFLNAHSLEFADEIHSVREMQEMQIQKCNSGFN